MRVVIAEDLALLRDGLTRLLRDNEIEVIAAVRDGDALSARWGARPDLAVVDIRLPPEFRDEGLRAALELRKRVPDGDPRRLPIRRGDLRRRAVAGGAEGVGYLLKDRIMHVADSLEAVRRVADGGTALDPDVVAQLFRSRREDAPLARLTPREREVLALMAEGRSNAGIAETLVLTVGAVEKHVQSIMSKLELPPAPNDHRRVLAVLAYLRQDV